MPAEDWEKEHDWEKDARCLDEDPELFFPGRAKAIYRITATEAKAVCKRCPVQQECLTKALETDERYGIWGGLSHRERNALLRKRARQSDYDQEQA